MTDGSATKVCPMCAETIKAAAKVCPFCQTRQNKFALWQQALLGLFALITSLGLAAVFVAWVLPDKVRIEGRSYVRHRGELRVVRTALDRRPKRPEVWLSGHVTNIGDHPWRVRELEVRFLDAQGHLVDVYHPNVEDPFVVQPHHEHAFRVALGRLVSTNEPWPPQVRVQAATDGQRPLSPD